jgi:hypothetical protein
MGSGETENRLSYEGHKGSQIRTKNRRWFCHAATAADLGRPGGELFFRCHLDRLGLGGYGFGQGERQ